MIPTKGGVADKLGIKFSGNPDVKDWCEQFCQCEHPEIRSNSNNDVCLICKKSVRRDFLN